MLLNSLKRAELDNFDSDTSSMLTKITRQYMPCQMNAQAPRRSKFALREYKHFNYTLFADIF